MTYLLHTSQSQQKQKKILIWNKSSQTEEKKFWSEALSGRPSPLANNVSKQLDSTLLQMNVKLE